jgi:iron(III) transport system permease protein
MTNPPRPAQPARVRPSPGPWLLAGLVLAFLLLFLLLPVGQVIYTAFVTETARPRWATSRTFFGQG